MHIRHAVDVCVCINYANIIFLHYTLYYMLVTLNISTYCTMQC